MRKPTFPAILTALALGSCGGSSHDALPRAGTTTRPAQMLEEAAATAGNAEREVAADTSLFGRRLAGRVAEWAREAPTRVVAAVSHAAQELRSAGRHGPAAPRESVGEQPADRP